MMPNPVFTVKVKQAQFWNSGHKGKVRQILTARIVEDDPKRPIVRKAGLRITSGIITNIIGGKTVVTPGTIYHIVD